jgi:hypothetical protein
LEFPANRGRMPFQPPGQFRLMDHSLTMEDANPFALGKMGTGHRCSGLSVVMSW